MALTASFQPNESETKVAYAYTDPSQRVTVGIPIAQRTELKANCAYITIMFG
jgi:hypothetical protein